MSYMKFSTKWAASLCKIHNLNQDKQAELAYAIEVLTITFVNALLTLTLGWSLGVFWGTLTCLLTVTAFRHNAGGGHSESPWRCGLVTIVIFPLLALLSRALVAWEPFHADLISFVAILMGFALIFKYAPVDSPQSPIVSPVRRKRLKRIAILIMLIAAIIIIGLRLNGWGKASEIRLCIVLGILWFNFNLSPLGKHLWCFIDGIGNTHERRCSG